MVSAFLNPVNAFAGRMTSRESLSGKALCTAQSSRRRQFEGSCRWNRQVRGKKQSITLGCASPVSDKGKPKYE
jgi:hypothetical protein